MTTDPLFDRPLSVVHGKDRDVIPLLLGIHAIPRPRILDVTYNRGVMWKGTGFSPVSVDVDPQFAADYTADCRDLPMFTAGSFDVVAFDPPHLPAHSASANSSGIERLQYGLTEYGDYRQGDTIHGLFEPFLIEARRVLKPKTGIVIAKIADYIHNHAYQWSHVDFINAARRLLMNPCDLAIKIDPSSANLKSSKWKNVYHLRRAHTYWIVVRADGTCETCGSNHVFKRVAARGGP